MLVSILLSGALILVCEARREIFFTDRLFKPIAINAVIMAMPGFKMVFGYEYDGEFLIPATWNALWSAMTFLGMSLGIDCLPLEANSTIITDDSL